MKPTDRYFQLLTELCVLLGEEPLLCVFRPAPRASWEMVSAIGGRVRGWTIPNLPSPPLHDAPGRALYEEHGHVLQLAAIEYAVEMSRQEASRRQG